MNTYMEQGLENCLIPRLLLQPIVENSIFHGLDDEDSELTIDLYIYSNNDMLTIKIRDNGAGMSKEVLAEIWSDRRMSGHSFNRIGLRNVRDRIQKIYGDSCGLDITSLKGEYTEVVLSIRKMFEDEYEKHLDS